MGCIFSKPPRVSPVSGDIDRQRPEPKLAWPPPEEPSSKVITTQPRPRDAAADIPPASQPDAIDAHTRDDSEAVPAVATTESHEINIKCRIVRCDYSDEYEHDKGGLIDPSAFPCEDVSLPVDVKATLDQCRRKVAETLPKVRLRFLKKGRVIREESENRLSILQLLKKVPGHPIEKEVKFKGVEYSTFEWKGKKMTLVPLIYVVVLPDETGDKTVEERAKEPDKTTGEDEPKSIHVSFRILRSAVVDIFTGEVNEVVAEQTANHQEDALVVLPNAVADDEETSGPSLSSGETVAQTSPVSQGSRISSPASPDVKPGSGDSSHEQAFEGRKPVAKGDDTVTKRNTAATAEREGSHVKHEQTDQDKEDTESTEEEERAIKSTFEEVTLRADETTTLNDCRQHLREKMTDDNFFFLRRGHPIPRSKEPSLSVFHVLPKLPVWGLRDKCRYHGIEYQKAKWKETCFTFAGVVNVVTVPEGTDVAEVMELLGPSRIEGSDVPSGGFAFIPFDNGSSMMALTPAGLHEAASYGMTDVVHTILSTFKPLPSDYLIDSRNATPLHYAAANGHDATAKYLIDNLIGNVNSHDINDRTALHLAIYYKKFSTIALLIRSGASINGGRDVNGNTPLTLLKRLPLKFWESHFSDSQQLPRDVAKHVASAMIAEDRTGDLEKVVDLLGDVNAYDLLGRTLLHEAAEAQCDHAIDVLLVKGARKDIEDVSGCTPLCIASRKGNVGVVEKLLVDTSEQRHLCHAILHALERKHTDIVIALLRSPCMSFDDTTRAAFTKQLSSNGIGQEDETMRILEACRDTLTNQRFLGWIAARGEKRLVEHFVETGVEISKFDYMGRTALHEAVQNDDRGMVQYLLDDARADPNARDWRGSTPLHYACQRGCSEIAHVLLERTDVAADLQDDCGRTPLLTALHNNKPPLALNLVEELGTRLGVSVSDKYGLTALHYTYLFHSDAKAFVGAIENAICNANDTAKDDDQRSGEELIPRNYKAADGVWTYHLKDKPRPIARMSETCRKKCHTWSSRKMDPDVPQSPLCLAIIRGNTDALLALCRGQESLLAVDMLGRSPLELAVNCDRTAVLDTLLGLYREHGIDLPELSEMAEYKLQQLVKPKEEYKMTHPEHGPGIHRACRAGDKSTVAVLLQEGEDATIRFKGKTCLEICIDEKNETVALEVIQHCIADKKMAEMLGSDDLLPLVIKAAGRDMWKTVDKLTELEEFTSMEVERKLAVDDFNQSIIHHMARAGQFGMLKRILSQGINDTINEVHGLSPLWYAIANQHWEVARFLLLYNSNPLVPKASMDVFMHRFRKVDIPKSDACLLTGAGACRPRVPAESKRKSHLAYFGGLQVAELVFKKTSETKSVDKTGEGHDPGKSGEAITTAEDVSSDAGKITKAAAQPPTSHKGKTYQEARCLLKLASSAANSGKSLLHVVASAAHMEYVQAILSVRPDLVNTPDHWGRTPLFYASIAGNKDIVAHMLQSKLSRVPGSPIVLTTLLACYVSHKRLSQNDIHSQHSMDKRLKSVGIYCDVPMKKDDGGRYIQGENHSHWEVALSSSLKDAQLTTKMHSVAFCQKAVSLFIFEQRNLLAETLHVGKGEWLSVLSLLLETHPELVVDAEIMPFLGVIICLLHDEQILRLFLRAGFDLRNSLEQLVLPRLSLESSDEEGTTETIPTEPISADNLIISTAGQNSKNIDGAFKCLLVLLAENIIGNVSSLATLAVEAAAGVDWVTFDKIVTCKQFQDLPGTDKLVGDRHGKSVVHYLAMAGKHSHLDSLLRDSSVSSDGAYDKVDLSGRSPIWYALAFQRWEVAKLLLLCNSSPLRSKGSPDVFLCRFNKADIPPSDIFLRTVHMHTQSEGTQLRRRKAYMFTYGSVSVSEVVFNKDKQDIEKRGKKVKIQASDSQNIKSSSKHETSEVSKGGDVCKSAPQTVTRLEGKQYKEVKMLFRLACRAASSSNSILHIAVAMDHLEYVEAILDLRPDLINSPDNLGRTPLVYASAAGNKGIVQRILQKDPGLVPRSPAVLATLLAYYVSHKGLSEEDVHSQHYADKRSRLKGIRFETALGENVDRDVQDQLNTDWVNAVKEWFTDAQLTIENLVSVAAVYRKSISLLVYEQRRFLPETMIAGKNEWFDVLSLLLEKNPGDIADSGLAQIMALLICQLHDEKILQLFMRAGFDLNCLIRRLTLSQLVRCFDEPTATNPIPLEQVTVETMIAFTAGKTAKCIEGAFKCLSLLLEQKIATDASGLVELALHAAAICEWSLLETIMNYELFRELPGKDKLVPGGHGMTLVHHLAKSGKLNHIELILKDESVRENSGFDEADNFGRTPLWYAIAFHQWAVAKCLILYGSCPLKCKSDMYSFMLTFRSFKSKNQNYTVFPLGRRRITYRPKDEMQTILKQDTLSTDNLKSRKGKLIGNAVISEKYGSCGVYEAVFKRKDVKLSTKAEKGKTKAKQQDKTVTEVKTVIKIKAKSMPRESQTEDFFRPPRCQVKRPPTAEDVQSMKQVRRLFRLSVCSGKNRATLLHAVAAVGDASTLKQIIGYRKEFLNQLDSSNMSPLFYAAATGNGDTAKCLLENGADPNVGTSPLLASSIMWHLMKAGSPIHPKVPATSILPPRLIREPITAKCFSLDSTDRDHDWKSVTKLLLPKMRGKLTTDEVLLLALNIFSEDAGAKEFLADGFDISAALANVTSDQPSENESFLCHRLSVFHDFARVSVMLNIPQPKIAECLHAILQSGSDETARDMVVSCISYKLWDALYSLLDTFNVQLDKMVILSVIVQGAEENQIRMVKKLISRLDMKGGRDRALKHSLVLALHTACKKGHVQMVDVLLETKECDVFSKFNFADEKLAIFGDSGNQEGAEENFLWGVSHERGSVLEMRLSGRKIQKYRSHWTALHWACHSGKIETLKCLENAAGGTSNAREALSGHFNPLELLYVSTLAGHVSVLSHLCESWELDPSDTLSVSHLWEGPHTFPFEKFTSPGIMEIAAAKAHHDVLVWLVDKAEKQKSVIELIQHPTAPNPLSLYHVVGFFGWEDAMDTLARVGVGVEGGAAADDCGLTPAAYALAAGNRRLYEQLCEIEQEENGSLANHCDLLSELIGVEDVRPTFRWLQRHLKANEDVKENESQSLTTLNLYSPRTFRLDYYIPRLIEQGAVGAAKDMMIAACVDMRHYWNAGDEDRRVYFYSILRAAVKRGCTDIIDLLLGKHEESDRHDILTTYTWGSRSILHCAVRDNQWECVQRLIDYGAELPGDTEEDFLLTAFESAASDGMILNLKELLGPDATQSKEVLAACICATGRAGLLADVIDATPSFDEHVGSHTQEADPTCFHCLRTRSIGWSNELLKGADLSQNKMLIPSTRPKVTDRLALPDEHTKLYHWILDRGVQMTEGQKRMLRTVFYNTSDSLEDIGCDQENLCYFLKACYARKPTDKRGRARLSHAAFSALDTAISLSSEETRNVLVEAFIDFHGTVGVKELLHIASIHGLHNLVQTLTPMCHGDTVFEGDSAEESTRAFRNSKSFD